MGKKYSPSGYTIITIDVKDKTSGTPFTPETDDEKLLYNLLINPSIRKPILLTVLNAPEGNYFTGFGTIVEYAITITDGFVGTTISERFSASANKLTWTENAE